MSEIGALFDINRHFLISPQKILYNIIGTQTVMDKSKDELRMSGGMATVVVTEDVQQKMDSLRVQHLPGNPICTMALFTHVLVWCFIVIETVEESLLLTYSPWSTQPAFLCTLGQPVQWWYYLLCTGSSNKYQSVIFFFRETRTLIKPLFNINYYARNCPIGLPTD